MSFRVPRLALLAILTACTAGPAAAQGDCAPRLERLRAADGGSLLHFRCPCECRGTSALVELLRARYGDAGPPAELTTLFVGRLQTQLPTVAEALALAASRDPGWSAEGAWTDAGYANGYVRDLLNREREALLGRLQDVFTPWGISLSTASVEKVLMARPRDLPYAARLLAAGAEPDRRLPFDAMVWLALERN